MISLLDSLLLSDYVKEADDLSIPCAIRDFQPNGMNLQIDNVSRLSADRIQIEAASCREEEIEDKTQGTKVTLLVEGVPLASMC